MHFLFHKERLYSLEKNEASFLVMHGWCHATPW